MGKRRLGYVIGLVSPTLRGPRHINQWTSEFARMLVKSSSGGEVYALSEMAGHMSMLQEFYAHFTGLPPGKVGLEDGDSSFARLKHEDIDAAQFSVPRLPAIQQAL